MIVNLWHRKTPYNLKTLAEIIEAAYSAQRDVDEHKQKTTFSPSRLVYGHGTCPRYWYAAFNGERFVEKFDPQSVDNMDAGTAGHERIQANISATLPDSQIEVEILSDDPPIRGFCDVVLKFDGYEIPVEIKTTRTEVFAWRRAKNKPAAYHIVQLLIYLYILDKINGLLLYEDKNDHNKLLIPVKMTDKNRDFIENLFAWMRRVYKAYEDQQLPKKQVRRNAKICKDCPVSEWCDGQPKEGVDIPITKIDYEYLDY